MITTLPSQSARPAKPTKSALRSDAPATSILAPDYRLLGLRPREARVEVIREAVHQAASQVQLDNAARSLLEVDSAAAEPAEDEQRLSEIAVAGYRLLDPRRRRTLFERVQLLMWTEEELDANLTSLWSSQPEAPPRVKIALKPAPQVRSASAKADANADAAKDDENQVALELFRSLRQRDRRALALWVGLASLTISLAASLGLFAWLASRP